jgi:cytochrome c oxidase cbb3-type subunit 4
MEIFHSFWTLVLLILFIALILWAWSSKRKTEFDKASRMPLDDEQRENGGGSHG